MKKKASRITAILLLMALTFTGCATGGESPSENIESESSIKIGMCFDSFVIERWQKDRDVFVATAQMLGAEVNVQNANGEVEKQIEQIEYFIDKKVDCIVIIPIDGNAIKDSVLKAKDAGIRVVSYDRLIREADADLYISFDNEAVGRMMGEAVVGAGAKSVLMICGPLTDNNVPMIESGFRSVMTNYGVDVLDTFYTEGWKAELGSAYVYENIDLVRSADAIMCGNDDVATAVIRALAVSQMAGVKTVVGQDADLSACQHIVEGTQVMTVYKPVEKLAAEAATLTVKLAKGKDLEVEGQIFDGKYNIPYVAIEPIAVNRDNIDEIIIDGGFHTKEDVYMNIMKTPEESTVEEESMENQ